MNLVHETRARLDFTIHYWSDGPASAPLVMFTHDVTVAHREWDAARDILNAMPVWAEHGSFAGPVIIRGAKPPPSIDQPELFHRHPLAFLNSQTGESQVTPHEGG